MHAAFAVALVGGMAWLYADAARGLVVQWATSPDASYGAILAAVALLIIWRRRREIAPRLAAPDGSAVGALVIGAGLAAYLAGIFAADLFITRASFVLVLGGLTWFLFGTRAAAATFTPLVFLLLAIPLPDLVVTALTSQLQTVAARSAEAMLSLGGIAVYRDGNVLELPATTLQIAEACSGLRSVVSLAAVGVLLAWATAGSLSRRAALIAATLPISVFANGLRVAATGAAAEAWGPAMARDPWHTIAGWLTFVVSLAAIWSIRWALLRHEETFPASLQEVRT
jgi:exosortase